MLKKAFRLTKAKDFKRIGMHGRASFGPLMTMRANNTKEAGPRIAFITSTKVFKRAVDRNRVKRRSREVVRSLLDEIPRGVQLIFIIKTDALKATTAELTAEVRRLITKIPETLAKPAKLSPRALKERTKRKR